MSQAHVSGETGGIVGGLLRGLTPQAASARIALVAALLILSLLLRWRLDALLGDRLVYAPFYPAVLVAGLLGGVPGGLLTLVCVLAATHAPVQGRALAGLSAPADFFALAVFLFNSAMILALVRSLRRMKRAHGLLRAWQRDDDEQLGQFVEQAPAAMAMFDRNMRYLAVSARWREDYGLDRDIVGKSHYEVFPEIGEAWKQVHASALAGETVRSDCDRFERADGETVWLRWEVRPWRHSHDGIGGVVIFSEDISDRIAIRRALEDNERRLTAILASAMEAIVTIDDRGVVLSANPAVGEIFGYEPEEVIGKNVDMLTPFAGTGRHDGYIAAYRATGERKVIGNRRELEGRRKDGALFPLELTVSEARIDGRTLFVGFMRDLSPIDAERRRVNALRDELMHVSRLNDMGEVVAGLAHEVGQPVAAILNFAAAARRTAARPADPSGGLALQPDLIGRIETQARRAGEIIKRLRGFIEKRPAERRPEDLRELIEEALRLAPLRSRAKIVLSPAGEDEVPVCVDRIQIEQVVVNLPRNADDALGQTAAPEIRVEIARPDASHLRVGVADNGPGVAPDALEKLFNAFFSTKMLGMGVGLSISKSIVESHGGEISYRANRPHGAVFEFTLPVAGAGDASDSSGETTSQFTAADR